MHTSFSRRGTRTISIALTSALLGACSSGDSANPTGPGTTGTTTTGSTGTGGSGTCEHVFVSGSEFGFGYEPLALAADGGQAYVLIDDSMGRTVKVSDNGKLREVGRAANESTIDLTKSHLMVDAAGYFFDAFQEGKKWLLGVPRAGGMAVRVAQFNDSKTVIDPPFVGDATSLYFVAPEPTTYRALSRVPRMAGAATAPVVVSDDTTFYSGLTAIAVAGSNVYAVNGSSMSYVAREYPIEPAMPVHWSQSESFTQSICSTFLVPPYVTPGSDALYLGCEQDGGGQSVIYRLPPAAQWTDDQNSVTLGPPVASGKIESDIFVVVGTTVYFADFDQDAVFKSSGPGGTPTRVLGTRGVDHMATDGTTLFVQGGCGIQSLSL